MGVHGMLMQLMLVELAILATTLAPATAQALPGCPNTCGNLSIPYPFGVEAGCFLNEDFRITCNRSVDPPLALLPDSSINVTDISINGQLRILTFVSPDCYNQKGERLEAYRASTSLLRFPFSTTRNKFTAVGCDTYAVINGLNGENVTTGCLSVCDSEASINDESCSGIGCCQTAIPKGLLAYTVSVSSYYNHTRVWDFNPCSYTFLVEEESFNFTLADLRDLQNRISVTTVLDWAVGNQTCKDAQKNLTSYACQANSDCHDSDNGPGYRCNCSAGYQGNAYLPGGCQDIDECAVTSPNPCDKICTNTAGSYYCSCPKGYLGDGLNGGLGCIAVPSDQSLVIKVSVGASIGGGLSLLLLFLGGFWLHKVMRKRKNMKLKEKYFKRNGGMLLKQKISSDDGAVEKTKIFTSKDLEKATDNFNENRIIGQGGQGTVYKGMLIDGSIVAIKKSRIVDESQLKPFINEVAILSQINHRNVVKLLGCCLETEVPLLVYEFISHGTLFQLIQNQDENFPLSWELRIQIATEVSGVLTYLHSACSIPIYHRDIKSTNILLDDKYRAKVSDFGTSRTVSIDQTHLTTHVQGTFGYLDPEYFQSNQFTEKSDVYSFGVVLVELLTGLKPITSTKSQEVKSLAAHFLSSLEDTCLFDILDARVIKEGEKDEIMAVANLAKRCLNLNGKKRPTMKEVTIDLEGIKMPRMPLTTQQNSEEGECSVEINAPSDGSLASTSAYLDYTQAFSLDVHPLLYNTRPHRMFSLEILGGDESSGC